jgi:hypothetical protein
MYKGLWLVLYLDPFRSEDAKAYLVNFTISQLGDFFQNFENVFYFSVSSFIFKFFDKMPDFSLNKRSVIKQSSVYVKNVCNYKKGQ